MNDVIVIGAGIVGTAVARELMRYNLKVLILEKDSDVAMGATKANSGIIHAGYDAPLGTQMSYYNVKGNAMYDQVAKELNIPFERIGSLVCAQNDEELNTLKKLYENGVKAGVPDMEILSAEETLKKEPNLKKHVKGSLYAPTCGIIEPWEVALAYVENAIENGAKLKLNTEVQDISWNEKERFYTVKTSQGDFQTKALVNAAGVYSDKIHQMMGISSSFTITPKRGQYFLLDKEAGQHVNHVVFPCPNETGKGILVLPTVDGNLLVGPDSVSLDEEDKENVSTTSDCLEKIRSKADELVKDIPYSYVITTFSGIRAEASGSDFIVGRTEYEKYYTAAGIKSPGLTSAPAIGLELAKYIAQDLKAQFNEDFQATRRQRIQFHKLNQEEKKMMIQKNPQYGRIICRCEQISEAEIVDAIKRPAGARTINGVKRRARPGAGRCQGGFCMPRVIEILSRELNIEPTEVEFEHSGSKILLEETK